MHWYWISNGSTDTDIYSYFVETVTKLVKNSPNGFKSPILFKAFMIEFREMVLRKSLCYHIRSAAFISLLISVIGISTISHNGVTIQRNEITAHW